MVLVGCSHGSWASKDGAAVQKGSLASSTSCATGSGVVMAILVAFGGPRRFGGVSGCDVWATGRVVSSAEEYLEIVDV
jgi:hypothetical protein